MPAILAYVAMAMDLIPRLISAGKKIGDLIQSVKTVIHRGNVTDADWDGLHKIETELRSNRPA